MNGINRSFPDVTRRYGMLFLIFWESLRLPSHTR
jgi:hypothetical protein